MSFPAQNAVVVGGGSGMGSEGSGVEKHAFLLYRAPVHYDAFGAAVRTRS